MLFVLTLGSLLKYISDNKSFSGNWLNTSLPRTTSHSFVSFPLSLGLSISRWSHHRLRLVSTCFPKRLSAVAREPGMGGRRGCSGRTSKCAQFWTWAGVIKKHRLFTRHFPHGSVPPPPSRFPAHTSYLLRGDNRLATTPRGFFTLLPLPPVEFWFHDRVQTPSVHVPASNKVSDF